MKSSTCDMNMSDAASHRERSAFHLLLQFPKAARRAMHCCSPQINRSAVVDCCVRRMWQNVFLYHIEAKRKIFKITHIPPSMSKRECWSRLLRCNFWVKAPARFRSSCMGNFSTSFWVMFSVCGRIFSTSCSQPRALRKLDRFNPQVSLKKIQQQF